MVRKIFIKLFILSLFLFSFNGNALDSLTKVEEQLEELNKNMVALQAGISDTGDTVGEQLGGLNDNMGLLGSQLTDFGDITNDIANISSSLESLQGTAQDFYGMAQDKLTPLYILQMGVALGGGLAAVKLVYDFATIAPKFLIRRALGACLDKRKAMREVTPSCAIGQGFDESDEV